jgi:raffinose/stachyose/melibiose transport system substrate-binding protein
MSRRINLILSILLIGSFALAACGTPATQASPAPTEAPAAQPTATEAMAEPTATQAMVEPTIAEPTATATAAPKVNVTWYHIQVADDQKALWQKMADDYMAAHSNVNIEITVLENEAFKTKLTTMMQSGNPPDIFQSWGGGTMNEYAKAGLLKDITADLEKDGWKDTFYPGALGV